MNPRGTHILIDLYGVPNPVKGCMELLRKAARIAGCRVLSGKEEVFEGGGGGVTAFLILSTSHASIHTWPETRYASVDFYSCVEIPESTVKEIVEHVQAATGSERHFFEVVPRGRDL